jgi:Nickel responsive protein SCO4226-like
VAEPRTSPERGPSAMRKFIVERGLPGIGSARRTELDAMVAIDNRIVSQLWPDIQWLTSYIAEDKSYCIYLAKDEATVRRHSELAGFPADSISELSATIDPVTPSRGA